VDRGPASAPASIEVGLLDLSRDGARFRSSVPLAEAEAITVRIDDERSGLRLTRSGTVRWTRPDGGGTWSVGCRFSRPLEWETLGELFLNEVLSQAPPARQAPQPAPAPSIDTPNEG
jgi:hypothetical protein